MLFVVSILVSGFDTYLPYQPTTLIL